MRTVQTSGTGKWCLSSITLLAALMPTLVLSQESARSEAPEQQLETSEAPEQPLERSEAPKPVLEMVLVTARHRKEDLKDVPLSMTVVNEDYIEQLGARSLKDIENVVPNFIMEEGGGRPEITIRGRKNSTETIGVESGVGVYVNGVHTSRVGSNVDLMEVEQIEVLRGPQGTLYGKNTVTGAINIRIKKPGDELKGGIATSLGEYGRQDVRGFIEGGLHETLAARLSVSHLEWDGYEKNAFTGKKRGGDDSTNSQLQLNYFPTDVLSIELMGEYRKQDRLGGLQRRFSDQSRGDQAANMQEILRLAEITEPLPLENEDKGSELTDRHFKSTNKGVSLTIDYTLDNDYALISISSWQDQDGELKGQDEDFFPHYGLTYGGFEKQKGVTQELRITSPGGQRIDWLSGLYYDKQELSSSLYLAGSDIGIAGLTGETLFYGVDMTPGANPAEVDTESIAVYGSLDFHWTDALTLTLGARYTYEDKTAKFRQEEGGTCITGTSDRASVETAFAVTLLQAGVALPGYTTACMFPQYDEDDLSYDTNSFDPAISLAYIFSDAVTGYAKVSTGYKSGGFNIDIFRPEEDSIQEGLLAGTGLFTPGYRDKIPHTLTFDDEEVISYELGLKTVLLENRLIVNQAAFFSHYDNMQEQVFIDGSDIVANVAEADVYGYELDMTWAVNANWSLIGSYGYVDTEYTDFPVYDSDGELDNRKGQEFGPPPWSASFSADYLTAITDLGSLRARLAYTETDGDPQIYNARITWDSPEGAFVISVWSDNITDERDIGYGVDRIFGLEYGIIGARSPRISGVDFKYKF